MKTNKQNPKIYLCTFGNLNLSTAIKREMRDFGK